MFMIVVLHVLGHGELLDSVERLGTKYMVLWLLETFGFCAVNCYALVSGYVHYESKYRLASLAMLYLQVLLYSLGIGIMGWILRPEWFSISKMIAFLFPVSKSVYWYASAYVGLFLLIPVLNAGVNALSRSVLERMLVLAFVLFSAVPMAFRGGGDAFGLGGGYSLFWLMLLYIVGAYIRKYEVGRDLKPVKAFLVYGACVLVSWGTKMAAEYLISWYTGEPTRIGGLVSYISPTMVFAAVFLFLCFKNAAIPGKLQKAIAVFSPAAFGVYLIHDHEYFRGAVIAGTFTFWTDHSVPVMVVGTLATAALIFAACILVDSLRLVVFKKLRLKEKLEALEQKLFEKYSM